LSEAQAFSTLSDFYPFYLSERANPTSRRLHFVGSSIAVALLVCAALTQRCWRGRWR
jgi:hypothetical protein